MLVILFMNSINSIKDMCNLPRYFRLNNGQNQDKHGRFDFIKFKEIDCDYYLKSRVILS